MKEIRAAMKFSQDYLIQSLLSRKSLLHGFTTSVSPQGFQFLLGWLSSWWGLCVLFVVSALTTSQGAGQRVAKGLPEHGAGEDVDDGVQCRVQEVQPQRHDGELGEGVESGAVPWAVRTDHPHTNGRDSGGKEAHQENCNDGDAHLHGLPDLVCFSHLPLLQEARDPDGAEQQHAHWDDELKHRKDPVHADQDDDGSWCLFVRREEEALGAVATALDVAVSQHGNARTYHQQPHKQRHVHSLMLGHPVQAVVRVDHLEQEDSGQNLYYIMCYPLFDQWINWILQLESTCWFLSAWGNF